MDNIECALQAERDGDLHLAAKAYGLEAFSLLLESNYEYGAPFRRGVTRIIESMSADIRASNRKRAEVNFELTEQLFHQIINESEKQVLVGLGWEWLGDANLLLQDPHSIEHYSNALDQFEHIDLDDQLFWGAEPEYDNAYGALERYLNSVSFDYPPDHSMNFSDRVGTKVEIAEKLLK